MQIVVFDDALYSESSIQPTQRRRSSRIKAQSTVPQHLCEDEILVADPQFIEAQGQSKPLLEGVEGQQGNDNHIKDLLDTIGVETQ